MSGPGTAMYGLVAELFPFCRSITGDGVRRTLERLAEEIDLEMVEIPSGTEVFDWTVPLEWNIRDAWVKDPSGRRVVDFAASNLHVMSYSVPIQATMPLDELRTHLHTLPDRPDCIPYRTSYYDENWGFCLTQRQLDALPDGTYEVCVDSTLQPGHLVYGEYLLPGECDDEVLISCHTCHPSLANDNLAGVAVAVFLAKQLRESAPLRFSYRFLFIPGTIGSITWLAGHQGDVGRIRHGLVLACLGDPGHFTYKRSRQGRAEIDLVVEHVLRRSGRPHRVVDFSPYGYDERQFCSPGFDLPVGCLTRTPHGQFPEYHTSADNLDFVRSECLEDSLATCLDVIRCVEANRRYLNRNPKCEPQLGKRGLYGAIGGRSDTQERQMAMLWVLNLSAGDHSLLDIAERSGLPFEVVAEVAEHLERADLLRPC
jgi:aminopeptidase-like protein